MIDQEHLSTAIGKLLGWLRTWCTNEAAYNGFVVHRLEAKRMWRLHDTAWTQSAIIRGYVNLYSKSQEERWHNAMCLAADFQASRLQSDTGKYSFAGHENDRFCSLVHCALANCALLATLPFVDAKRYERYLQTVQSNIDKYLIQQLWNEEEGAFRFSEVDYYSLNEDRFVVNFNCMAAECLLKFSDITKQSYYRDISLRVGQWLQQRVTYTHEFHKQLMTTLNENPQIDKLSLMPSGGLPYQFTPSQREPENCVAIYAGLSLRGINALYRATGEKDYATIGHETADFLLAMRDPETNLFYHTTLQGQVDFYPQFVAGASMILLGLDEISSFHGERILVEKTIESILEKSYTNGSFPSFIGKNKGMKRNGSGAVWEDVVAAVSWNAQLFEYLTRLVNDPTSIEIQSSQAMTLVTAKRFIYIDNTNYVGIISWWPLRSWGIYLMRKKLSHALISLNLPLFFSKLLKKTKKLYLYLKSIL